MRRVFTGEQKADYVRQADELGSDITIVRRHRLSNASIGRWRAEGYGRKLHTGSTGSPIERATSARSDSPSMRCPACASTFAVAGHDPESRMTAWQAHYAVSASCLAKNIRRVS